MQIILHTNHFVHKALLYESSCYELACIWNILHTNYLAYESSWVWIILHSGPLVYESSCGQLILPVNNLHTKHLWHESTYKWIIRRTNSMPIILQTNRLACQLPWTWISLCTNYRVYEYFYVRCLLHANHAIYETSCIRIILRTNHIVYEYSALHFFCRAWLSVVEVGTFRTRHVNCPLARHLPITHLKTWRI